ncbi:MAG: DUF2723 domain-containing protein [Acidobacteriia bacterium]|nr:DUF2723 domain-containing protein [Terriglobia bacterium]
MRRVAAVAARHPFVALPFLFYLSTCSRGIGMSDTAILIGDMLDLRLSAEVNSHNFSLLFGRLFTALPIGGLAFRANLMSVFFGGLAVSLFYSLVVRSLRSRTVAAMAATLLMVSHSMWWHSTIVESYAINACFVVGALLLLARYREAPGEGPLLWLIALSGISLFHHAQLGVIGLAAVAVASGHVARLARGPGARAEIVRFAGRAAVVAAASLVPYGLVLLSDAWSAGGLRSAVSAAAGGPFKDIMFRWAGGLGIADTAQLTLLQFPSPFLLLVPVGFLRFLQTWRWSAATAGVLIIFGVTGAFFALYQTWDRFAFLLVSFLVLAFWGAFALDQLVAWAREGRSLRLAAAIGLGFVLSVATPPWLYARMGSWRAPAGSVWAMRFGATGESSNTIDPARFVANPDKRRYRDIDAYFGALLDKLPPNATYLDDDSRYNSLEFYRLYEGRRPDLETNLVNLFGFADWGLSKEAFAQLVGYAHAADLPLFLATLGPPFDVFLRAAGKPYRFEVFPLDDLRFVYRLVTAAQDGTEAPPPFVPVPRGLHVGKGRDPMALVPASSVGRNQDLVVRFDFDENPQPFPVAFRWIAADGRAGFSSPVFVVPALSGSAAWIQERRGVLRQGRWRVEAWVGAKRVDGIELDVR